MNIRVEIVHVVAVVVFRTASATCVTVVRHLSE